MKKEYSLRGPLTTDKVIKLAHAIAAKNRNSEFQTYPSKTWLKNNIYSDDKFAKYTEGKKIVMKSETHKKTVKKMKVKKNKLLKISKEKVKSMKGIITKMLDNQEFNEVKLKSLLATLEEVENDNEKVGCFSGGKL